MLPKLCLLYVAFRGAELRVTRHARHLIGIIGVSGPMRPQQCTLTLSRLRVYHSVQSHLLPLKVCFPSRIVRLYIRRPLLYKPD